MSGLNRYYRRSHISEKNFRLLIRYFVMDLSASQTAVLLGISRRTINTIFLKIRERLAFVCEQASPFSHSEVEVDESYFGARRVRGKRGRGAGGKHIVFGIYKRNGSFLPRLFPMSKEKRCKPLFAVVFHLIRSFIRTAGAVITVWLIQVLISITASIIQRMNSPQKIHTSTA